MAPIGLHLGEWHSRCIREWEGCGTANTVSVHLLIRIPIPPRPPTLQTAHLGKVWPFVPLPAGKSQNQSAGRPAGTTWKRVVAEATEGTAWTGQWIQPGIQDRAVAVWTPLPKVVMTPQNEVQLWDSLREVGDGRV